MNDTDDHTGRRGTLATFLPDRLAGLSGGLGWRRTVLARRVMAGLLVLAAIVLAVRAPPEAVGGTPVVVAVHELASGVTVTLRCGAGRPSWCRRVLSAPSSRSRGA
ncbi:MAG TPA: hypothetical protein VH008_27180 [Pseudonocardia sp.]|nr:hypothetical protein [Pseudonocardia sp.]